MHNEIENGKDKDDQNKGRKIKSRQTKGDKKGIDKGIENVIKNEMKRRHR